MSSKIPVKTVVWNANTSPLLAAAWTEVLAALQFSASHLEVYNGSTTPIQISVGSVGNENVLPYTIMGGGTPGLVKQKIDAASRISLKPVDSDISDGFIVLNLFTEVT
jgi:hypothetical protein